ncbi:glycosyl hydrolase [Gongronella butleri]|nr:glycosyl hydrolase [Gongronella butleri]
MATSQPIVPGFNPDPSICRVNDDYYLVTSTFQFFPGVPVYHSSDLKHWTQIGNALHRPEQLPDLDDTVINGGIWAPTLRFHNGTYYMCTTIVFADRPPADLTRWKNFFVTASDPAGPWSDPIYFDYPGYDTSLYFTDDNRCLVHGSFYFRIRAEISQFEIDINTGKALTPIQRVWSGTPGAKAPEAPHVLYKNGYYYLIIAEGGTEEGHSVSLARAKAPDAPEAEWEVCPRNPVLTHRHLPDELVQCTGHADFFDDGQGNWWVVFLAVRSYDGVRFPMGRESWVAPIKWDGDWPEIHLPIRVPASLPLGPNVRNVLVSDASEGGLCSFGAANWHNSWMWLRQPKYENYRMVDLDVATGQHLGCVLTATPMQLDDEKKSPTMISMRQCHVHCRVTVDLALSSMSSGTTAGLVAYLDCKRFTPVTCTNQDGQFTLSCLDNAIELPTADKTVTLAIDADEKAYKFSFKVQDTDEWFPLHTIDNKIHSTGFTGVVFGLFAVGQGMAHFSNVRYTVPL